MRSMRWNLWSCSMVPKGSIQQCNRAGKTYFQYQCSLSQTSKRVHNKSARAQGCRTVKSPVHCIMFLFKMLKRVKTRFHKPIIQLKT